MVNGTSGWVWGEHFSKRIDLSDDRCQFFHCLFQGSSSTAHFVFVSDQSLKCSFISCLFYMISTDMTHCALYIENAAEGITKSCCFHNTTTRHPYGTGVSRDYCLISASVNSTVCTKSFEELSPFCGDSKEFTFYHNNNSHLTSEAGRSCYCHVRTPNERDDVCCFFSGTSCVSVFSIDFLSSISGCIISKFDFINNSESSGCIRLYYPEIRTIITIGSLVWYHQIPWNGFTVQSLCPVLPLKIRSWFRQNLSRMMQEWWWAMWRE